VVVILFTTELPNKIADALEVEGLEVYEALAISEVLALAEQHPISSIIRIRRESSLEDHRCYGNLQPY
jgi:hypothetical protein